MRNPIQLLKGAVGIFQENPTLFIGVVLVPMILSIIAALFEPSRETGVINTSEWVVFLVLTVITLIANIFMGIALTLAVANRGLSVRSAYSEAKPLFWRYIGLSILLTVILMVGYILFIIPGIILSVWFAFATFVLILEGAGIVDSMKRSREYVKGKWWAVFGRLLFLMLIGFIFFAVLLGLASLLPGGQMAEDIVGAIVSLVVAPIMVGYMYLLYQDTKGPGTSAIPSPEMPPVNTTESTV